ncbi:DUF1062 domain-containing protein [Dysgonomonas termitidis]
MPLLKRKCAKCNSSSQFYCSDKFRINAQKKILDVWLIYRCTECDSTFNLTILSRIRPESIEKNLYQKFLTNDANTAWNYASDIELMKRNNVEVCYKSIEYDIIHQPITVEEMVNMEEDKIEFCIITAYDIHLKLSSVIRQCLNISLNRLEKMIAANVMELPDNTDLKKCKIKNQSLITIDRLKLKDYIKQFAENDICS